MSPLAALYKRPSWITPKSPQLPSARWSDAAWQGTQPVVRRWSSTFLAYWRRRNYGHQLPGNGVRD